MAFLKNASTSPSSSFEINLLSSDSSEAESVGPSLSTKKRTSAAKKKVSKKARFALPDSLTDAEFLRFLEVEHKIHFVSFSKCPIVPGRVVNLEQLEASHCAHGICLINNKWYKKEFVQQRADAPKVTRISVDSAALLLKEADLIKVRLDGLESHMQVLQDTIGKVLQLHKDSSTDVGKLRLEVEGLKKQAIRYVNTILKEVNSIKTGADSAHNELDAIVHTSYSNFSKNVERTYDSFCRNVLNTLKYLLGRGR
ncbi:hypothetical protein KY290_012743 [Solanum tuberosum]|uniref:Uncharacterized protein n=1 Tax=Solanum tuberosum TaxID=4113 RepID=A0ABQ7VJN0_SOLTU|nr:hypothetical protein KY285_015108 [Solanum tuberosum]KAH0768762.1 hypothetical protein KY290_012743 [Solanum tuberosum]